MTRKPETSPFANTPAPQALGQMRWYEHYEVRIARVERAYSGPQGRDMVSPQAAKD